MMLTPAEEFFVDVSEGNLPAIERALAAAATLGDEDNSPFDQL